MNHLFEQIKKRVDEEGDGAVAPASTAHTTTSANIAFLPCDFPSRKRKKKKVVKTSEASEKEAEKKGFAKKIEDAVYDLFVLGVVERTDEDLANWMQVMGGQNLSVIEETLMDFNDIEDDADNAITMIVDEYIDDIGNMEMVIDALKKHKPLRAFEPFVTYDYLIGSRIRSYVKGTEVTFEAFVDMMFQPSEKITMNDKDILSKIPEYRNIKVVGKTIYPVGDRFVPGFFKTLREIIES